MHPYDDLLIPLEKQMTDAVSAALLEWWRQIKKGVNQDTAYLIAQRISDKRLQQNLRDTLAEWLRQSAESGATWAADDFEKQVLGTKAIGDLVSGVAWDLANEAAASWALLYADTLTGALAKTTTPRIQRLISDWITNGESFKTLIDRIQDGWIFSAERANAIAVTEVTRAFARGNQAAWEATGVIKQQRWNTANDEIVCPVCGPLHNAVADVGGTWRSGLAGELSGPPAHVRCRCFVTGVVPEATARPVGLNNQ